MMFFAEILSVYIRCLFLICVGADVEGPTVTINNGKIVGELLKSSKGREYSAFAGIPYAKPPIGDLRFQAPQRNEPWEGTLKTSTKIGTICCQSAYMGDGLEGQEDCLFINVYTPKLYDNLLPVMVFIHGGGYYSGSGTFEEYGPQRLMDKDVVLVTFNYRLGPLCTCFCFNIPGFLAYPEEGIPGNNGLLDQIAALKWIQENIESFGGDKSKVTIFGESAGAASVIHLVSSPLAKDLFHGAISQSGSSLCDWGLNPNPAKTIKFLSVKLNCTTYPAESMMECLRNKAWKDILMKSKEFEVFPGLPILHRPNIDGNVIPDNPLSLLQQGKVNDVPVIIGVNKNEGAGILPFFRKWYPRTGEDYLKYDFAEILSVLIDRKDINTEFIDKIRQKYFQDVDLNNKTDFNHAVVRVLGDAVFGCCQRTARYLAKAINNPTYVYIFSYRGNFSYAENQEGEDLGVDHADDLQYLFPMNDLPEKDQKMSEIMLSLWTNFAKSLNPTPSDDGINNDRLLFVWPPYEEEEPKCIQLNLNSATTDKCEYENVKLWMQDFPIA